MAKIVSVPARALAAYVVNPTARFLLRVGVTPNAVTVAGTVGVFLGSYLTRIALFGDTHFPGVGAVRYVYFFLLISHVGLALLIAPAVIWTVVLGVKDQRDKHKRIAPKVLPVWIYVLATGVLVYLFLHHWA